MDSQYLMVCFWMMFLRYLEGFCQKTIYYQTLDIMRVSQVLRNLRYPLNPDQNSMLSATVFLSELHDDDITDIINYG